eukprot:Em0013g852a
MQVSLHGDQQKGGAITELVAVAEEAIFGSHASSWPLTKILDIGGTERVPHYSTSRGGEALLRSAHSLPRPLWGGGEWEVLKALEQFGCYDDLYSLLNVYEIHPWETWHIEEKVIHAPGKLTFTPSKMYTNLKGFPMKEHCSRCYQLGDEPGWRLQGEMVALVHNEASQGLLTPDLTQAGGACHRPLMFVGHVMSTDPSCIAWSGVGTVNGQDLNCTVELMKEFLVVPNHSLEICKHC